MTELDSITVGASETAVRMTDAAVAWVASLDDTQLALARFAAPGDPGTAEDDRLTWFFTPTDHGGLTLHEQSATQQSAAMRLVSSGLSLGGYATASMIMSMENVLERLEDWRVTWGRERGRDPQQYYLRVFGTPGEGTWAWRFGGHHVSLNYLVRDGRIASYTPSFFGSDPASIALPGSGRLRPLGAGEDLARELLESLTDAQRDRAVLLDRAPADVVMGNRTFLGAGDTMPRMDDVWRGRFATPREADYIAMIHDREDGSSGFDAADHALLSITPDPKGLPASALDADQQRLLVRIMRCYVERLPDDLAAKELTPYEDVEELGKVHFLWAGDPRPGARHYYRIQGPQVLIEYDNTQRNGNHCHAVWRNPQTDFGLDELYEHVDAFHRPEWAPEWPIPPREGRA